MKWLFSVHKTTQRILNSQGHHLHGGSLRRILLASNPVGWSKPDQTRSSSLYTAQFYSTSTIQNVTESSYRLAKNNKIEKDAKRVDLEVISKEIVKPSSPTPGHLRTFKLSIIDQYMYDVYIPAFLFLPNTDKANVADVVTKRSKLLKESLSKILTKFYPCAGKIKNNLEIECNDGGVYYTEARVNQTLEDFLTDPYNEKVEELMPESPSTGESSFGNYIIGIQVNTFKCGGIGLATTVSHKIFDGQTYYMFMKAWAAATRGLTDTVSPSYIASDIFPNNPGLKYSMPSKLLAPKMLTTKRFVFDSTALALLKAIPVANASSTHPPTRNEATSAVIWKAAAKAAANVRPFGPESPYVLITVVNIRKKASPPLPKEAIGNIFDPTGVICYPGAGNLDLPTLMGDIRESLAKKNTDHIETMKGVKGHETFNEGLRRFSHLTEMTAEGDCLLLSSLLNGRVYRLDFGWGTPIWFYVMNPGLVRFVVLNETLKGGGVEAIVTLSPEEMEIFERDPELLSYASVNPSPLKFV